MSALSIHLFGKFCARQQETVLDGFGIYKVQELLSYLLLNRTRAHSREAVAGLLWGDTSTAQSRKYLRKALWQLQSALDSLIPQPPIVLVETEWIRVNSEASFWLDVAEFEEAFRRAEGIPGHQLDHAQFANLVKAAELYSGSLLDGWYQDWCLLERERLQDLYLTLLDKLVGYCEANHAYEIGLVYAGRILKHDRARERTHRQLMRLHYLNGDRSSALRQHERCVVSLKEDLGVRPDKRTVALYDLIRNDKPLQSPDNLAFARPPESLSELHDDLVKLRCGLADAQQQVEEVIRALETGLKHCEPSA